MYVYIIADKYLNQFFVGLTENINTAYRLVYSKNCDSVIHSVNSLNVVYHAWFPDSSRGIEMAQEIQKYDRDRLEAFISEQAGSAFRPSRYTAALGA